MGVVAKVVPHKPKVEKIVKKLLTKENVFYWVVGLIIIIWALVLQFTVSHWFFPLTLFGLIEFTSPFWRESK